MLNKYLKTKSATTFLVFVVVFAALGTYLLFSSFASTPVVATLQAERMNLAQP